MFQLRDTFVEPEATAANDAVLNWSKPSEKNVSELMADKNLNTYSCFDTKDGSPSSNSKRRREAVQTSCIDNLDHTNVVQVANAHRIINDAWKEMVIFDSDPKACTVAKPPKLEATFKNTWPYHADALSLMYANFGALKTDFSSPPKHSKVDVEQVGCP